MPAPRRLIELRKAAVLEAASRLFLEQGYASVSINNIIEQVGGSKSSIYNNFGTKADLFLDAIRALCGEIAAPLANLDTHDLSLKEGLKRIGMSFIELSLSDRSIALHRLVIAERLEFPEIGVVFMQAGPERSYKKVSDFLARQQQLGAITREISSIELATVFLGMLNAGLLSASLTSSGSRPSQNFINHRIADCITIFMNGAKPETTKPLVRKPDINRLSGSKLVASPAE